MSVPIVHQRVYRKKGSHRRIGLVTDVVANHVRVLWAGTSKPSKLIAYHGLTVVIVRQGATVIRGNTSPVQPITPRSPLFGIVTNIGIDSSGNEDCSVTWGNRTVTTLRTQDVMDINWLPPVPLSDSSLKDWLKAFEMSHNIDITSVTNGTYRCSRNYHVQDCLCHSDVRKINTHHLLPSCMCQFRITVLDNAVQFSGTHVHHIPGMSPASMILARKLHAICMQLTCNQRATNMLAVRASMCKTN
jgi:hypothetical protein